MPFDTFPRPAGFAIHDLATALASRIARRIARRQMTMLRDLDDHALDDIGLARGDIERVLRMPLSTDAATELHRVAMERARRRG